MFATSASFGCRIALAIGCVSVLSTAARAQSVVGRPESEATKRIRTALRQRADVDFADTKLSDVATVLAKRFDINVVVDCERLQEIGVAPDVPVSLRLKGARLREVLRLIHREIGATYLIHDDAIWITTAEFAEEKTVVRVYPVADLLVREDATVPFSQGNVDFQPLCDAILRHIAPNTWPAGTGPGSIDGVASAGAIVIEQTDEVHYMIEEFLTALRQARDQQHDVLTPGPLHRAGDEKPVAPDNDERACHADAAPANRILAALRRTTDVDFAGTKLSDAAAQLAERFGIVVAIDRGHLKRADVDPDAPITLQWKGAQLRDVLRRMLRPIELDYTIRDDVLLISTAEDVADGMLLRVYPVAKLALVDPTKPYAHENADLVHICDVIRNNVAPNTWQEAGWGTIDPFDEVGVVIVAQTPQVHLQIEDFLTSLRQAQVRQGELLKGNPAQRANDDKPVVRVYHVQTSADAELREALATGSPKDRIEAARLATDELANVVRESIAPGTWNERSNNSLRNLPGALVVRHRPARQKQVEALLNELRVLINPSQLDPTIGGLR